MQDEFAYLEEKIEQITKKGFLNYKSIKQFFVIISISILLSPALFTSYISNDTQIEDYPLSLQQAFAESQPITQRIASPDDPYISDRELTNYGNGTYSQAIGVPTYVLDSSDMTFKDSYKNENGTHI